MTIMKLIDKDTLVAEIEKWENMYKTCPTRNSYEDALKEGRLIGYKDVLHRIATLEVKEVDLEEEVDKDDYRNLFKDCTKLNIDSTTEIKFDESTKFSIEDYIKLKEEEKTNSSKFYKRIFKNIPTVSMKIFSWWNTNKRKEI